MQDTDFTPGGGPALSIVINLPKYEVLIQHGHDVPIGYEEIRQVARLYQKCLHQCIDNRSF